MTLPGFYVAHNLIVDGDRAALLLLQYCDYAEGGGLATTRSPGSTKNSLIPVSRPELFTADTFSNLLVDTSSLTMAIVHSL